MKWPRTSRYFKFLLLYHSSYMLYPTTTIIRNGKQLKVINGTIRADRVKYRNIFLMYAIATSSYYALSTILFGLFADEIIDHTDRYSVIKCYFPKLVLSRFINNRNCLIIAFISNIFHLVWRITIYRGDFKLDMISFLINENGQLISSDDLVVDDLNDMQNDAGESLNRMKTSSELVIESKTKLMFIEAPDKNCDRSTILRPCRTLKARKELLRSLDDIFFKSMTILLLVSLFCIITGLDVIITQQKSLFPGCDQHLFSWSLIIRSLGSASISCLYLIDIMLGLVGPVAILELLEVDLKIYWRYILKQIDYLERNSIIWTSSSPSRSRTYPLCCLSGSDSTIDLPVYDDNDIKSEPYCHQSNLNLVNPLQINSLAAYNHIIWRRAFDLYRHKMSQLRTSLIDFFGLVHRVDSYVSLVIPYSLGIWVTGNAILTICGLQMENPLDSRALRAIQVGVFFAIYRINLLILDFKHDTESAYVDLCSLIGRNPTTYGKSNWLGVLSYYTDNPRYSFTLFGTRVYTRLHFLTVISYSVTFIFLYENLRLMQPL